MTVKLLTEQHLKFLSLKGGCTGSSESIHVKMPHCWKSHVTAQLILFNIYQMYEEWGSALKEAAEDDSVVLAVVTGKPTLPVAGLTLAQNLLWPTL